MPVVEADMEAVEVLLAPPGDLGDASSAPMKCTSWPCIRWNRTQMSAWMYSIMWPMWNGAFA